VLLILYTVGLVRPEPWCSHAHRRRSSGAAGPIWTAACGPIPCPAHRHLGSPTAAHRAGADELRNLCFL